MEHVTSGIRTGFLQIDEHMREMSERNRSGSTAVGAMISPRRIFLINCGDSRGLLSRAGTVHFSTQDHKPSNPLEKQRIQNAGGSVMIQVSRETFRMQLSPKVNTSISHGRIKVKI